MWPSESAESAPPIPPSRAEIAKLVPLTHRTDVPRYSTRISLSRAASESSPRSEAKWMRQSAAAMTVAKLVKTKSA